MQEFAIASRLGIAQEAAWLHQSQGTDRESLQAHELEGWFRAKEEIIIKKF
jgi:hypothetical protein